MITVVHINKFRSCEHVDLNKVGNLLVLIGHNGAGKSNILKAITWVAKKISNKINLEEAKRQRISDDSGDIFLEFSINGNLYEYKINYSTEIEFKDAQMHFEVQFKESLYSVKNGMRRELLIRDGEKINVPALDNKQFEVSKNISAISAMQSLLSEGNSFRVVLESVTEFFSNVVYYPLELSEKSEAHPLITQEQYQEWLTKPSDKKDVDQVMQMKILHLFLTKKEKFHELVSLIGQDGLEIISNIDIQELGDNVPTEEPNRISKIYFIRFRPSGHAEGKTFSIADLSFGTKRILSFILSLIYDSASVALVEQIEDGIHEGLIDKLVQLIRDYADGSQFILASHSTAVFNRLKPEEIRVVELDKGVTKVRSLSELEITAAISYMKNEGALSEFLQSI